MTKYTRFHHIPQFTRAGSWECGFPFDRVWKQLEEWKIDYQADLDPDFQRAHVWTEDQQIAWLEFFFRGGKTGRVIYMNCPEFGGGKHGKDAKDPGMVLVDGKQRLEALRRFMDNEIEIFGSLYRDFEDGPTMVYGVLKINMNDLPTRAEVIQWYIEMNSGGTPHTEAELAKARELLYIGEQ